MSVEAVRWVLEHSRARGRDRLVLLAIAERANKADWSCYPSVKTISEEAGVSRASVFRSLSALIAMGELVRVSGGGTRSNRYRIVDIPRVSVDEDVHSGLNERWDPSHRCDPTRLNGETRTIIEPVTTSFGSPVETPSHSETRGVRLVRPCETCGAPTQFDCTCATLDPFFAMKEAR